jgi:hypothetical protein
LRKKELRREGGDLMTPVSIALSAVLIVFSVGAFAQDSVGGGTIVRVPDSVPNDCIHGQKDAIWLTLRRVITTKERGWLAEDRSVGIAIQTLVRTQPQSPKAISYPLLTAATLQGFTDGQVSIPVEYSIIDSLRLVQGPVRYSGLQIDVTLINKKGRTKWGNALVALQEVTKKLPIPADPFIQSASYLLDFTNKAVSKDLADQDTGDKAKGAAISLNFDPSGQCRKGAGESFEKTGTLAVVYAEGTRGGGYVPIASVANYCWAADFLPAFALKAAKKPSTGKCDEPTGPLQFQPVTNNYTAFVLNAQPLDKLYSTSSDLVRQKAIRRCRVNGIDEESCLRVSTSIAP